MVSTGVGSTQRSCAAPLEGLAPWIHGICATCLAPFGQHIRANSGANIDRKGIKTTRFQRCPACSSTPSLEFRLDHRVAARPEAEFQGTCFQPISGWGINLPTEPQILVGKCWEPIPGCGFSNLFISCDLGVLVGFHDVPWFQWFHGLVCKLFMAGPPVDGESMDQTIHFL